LQTFVQKWKRVYPHLPLKLKETEWENYFAYLQSPSSVLWMVDTTHWIERLNKEIRRTHQGSFPKYDNPMNLIAAALMDFEQRVYKPSHPEFYGCERSA
jgi:transposase-like protein